MTTSRKLQAVIESVAASDGAGVKLRRSLGSRQNQRFDPFLMLDEFFSDDPDDYLAGFPSHPHRGFETVTYMLDGHMRHEDSFGNRGDLGPGDVQWMTAARGIIHSEMPQQTAGRMRGFQLWINLPAKEKMKPAAYRDIPAREIPTVALAGGGELRVIAGEFEQGGTKTAGPIGGLSTAPLYFDLAPAGAASKPRSRRRFRTTRSCTCTKAKPWSATRRSRCHSARLDCSTPVSSVRIRAGEQGVRLLLLAGKPIGEPVVQYGPFVMNTPEEIQQAVIDYQRGQLAVAS